MHARVRVAVVYVIAVHTLPTSFTSTAVAINPICTAAVNTRVSIAIIYVLTNVTVPFPTLIAHAYYVFCQIEADCIHITWIVGTGGIRVGVGVSITVRVPTVKKIIRILHISTRSGN
jgi:hypothetical protein